MDAAYWQSVCVKAQSIMRRWAAEQKRTVAIFTALSEFQSRLRLFNQAPVGVLKEQPITRSLLHAKHVQGLENLISALRDAMKRFEQFHTELAELHSSIWERHSQVAEQHGTRDVDQMARPSISMVGMGRGLDAQLVGLPPTLELVDWFQELHSMFTQEFLLKLQLIDMYNHDMEPAHLANMHRVWTLQPNLSTAALERLEILTESLTVPGVESS